MSIKERFLRGIISFLSRFLPPESTTEKRLAGLEQTVADTAPRLGQLELAATDAGRRLMHLEHVSTYLEYQVTRLAIAQRQFSAQQAQNSSFSHQTKASFDFQWDKIPAGRFMLENEEFRKEAPGYVTLFTGLPAEWFQGKNVADVGCGLGRYSWALCSLGASVLSMDQSVHGLERTRQACAHFPGHRTLQIDLLAPLPLEEKFDLVWCYGVLHHTGDTHGAFRRVAALVKPGGYLFIMIYGEPRIDKTGDYEEVNVYEKWRRRTQNLDLGGKLEVIRQGMARQEFPVAGEEHVHGYFDAIAPSINDLHTFEEVESWLLADGFQSIQRTVEMRNLHLIARKAE